MSGLPHPLKGTDDWEIVPRKVSCKAYDPCPSRCSCEPVDETPRRGFTHGLRPLGAITRDLIEKLGGQP